MTALPVWDGPVHAIPEGIDTIVETMSGTRLCIQVFGDPEAPLQVQLEGHGAQLISLSRQFCVDLAARGFRVVRVDNRDVGLSQKFPDTAYDLTDMAEDVYGLIEMFGGDPAVVCGRSMGGMIAQLLALRHPGAVSALGLFYTAPRPGRRPADIGEPAPRLPEAEFVEDYVNQIRPLAGSIYPYDLAEVTRLGHQLWRRDADPHGPWRQSRAMASTEDWSADLGAILVPTAILHGDEDPLFPLEIGEELHRRIPGSMLRGLWGMGHGQPSQLDKAFVETCATLGGADAGPALT